MKFGIAAMTLVFALIVSALGQGMDRPYLLGAGDQISVQVANVEEFDGKPLRVDDSGNITLPFVGHTPVAGMTLPQLEADLTKKLTKYVITPVVSVSLTDRRTQPVTVSGSVKSPGVLNVPPGRTLFEVLTMAGGVLPDAGARVRITRRASNGALPVSGAVIDPTGQYSYVDIPMKDLETANSADNLVILPNDFISVPKADLIYVIGDVQRAGTFALAEGQTVSVLQAVAMAGGTLKTAATSRLSIKRVSGEDKRIDIPVNLDKIMSGKLPDPQLQAKDILVIPGSMSRSVLQRTITSILEVGTGVVIRAY